MSVHPPKPVSCHLPVSLPLLVFPSPPLPLLLSLPLSLPLSLFLSLSLSLLLSTTRICVDAAASLPSSHTSVHTGPAPTPSSDQSPEPSLLLPASRSPRSLQEGQPCRGLSNPAASALPWEHLHSTIYLEGVLLPAAWEGCDGMCCLLFAGKQDG